MQAHDDASPAKWHLAHTAWFFEELILKPCLRGYEAFDPRFSYCFNSYYEKPRRQTSEAEARASDAPLCGGGARYRAHVDEKPVALDGRALPEEALALIEIGINHEQQHQELMLTDILALFAANPLRPAYRAPPSEETSAAVRGKWRAFKGGLYEIGHRGSGFAYDNEGPPHSVLLPDFRIFSRCVTNGEWLAFMDAGGYKTPSLWLSDGWATVQREGWEAPLYWERRDAPGAMTLHGLARIEESRPVTTSAITKPTPSPAGPAIASPPSSNGRPRRRARRAAATRSHLSLAKARSGRLRRRVAMDRKRLPALPRLPPRQGRARRI